MAAISTIQGQQERTHLGDIALWLPSIAVVGVFAIIGRWVHWVADDFCRGAAGRDLGLIGIQVSEYNNWSGRYTFNASIGLATRIGLQSSHIAPPVLAALSIALFTAIAARLPASLTPKRYAPLLGLLGTGILFGLYDNFGQSVLWLTGGLTYIVPCLLFGWGLLCAFPKTRNPKLIVANRGGALVLTFLAVGCNEAIGALTVGSLVVASLVGGPAIRRGVLPATLASILGFAVMAASPGNNVRRSFTTHRALLDLPIPAGSTLLNLYGWLLSQRPMLVGVAVMIGVTLGRRLGAKAGLGYAGFFMLVGVPYGVVLLGHIGAGARLAQRARIAVIVPMFVGLVLGSWFASSKWGTQPRESSPLKKHTLPICAAAIFICAIRSVVPAAAAAHNSSDMAERSNQRLLEGRGTTSPIGIPGPMTIWGLPNFSGDGDWALRCADSYFKVKGTYINVNS